MTGKKFENNDEILNSKNNFEQNTKKIYVCSSSRSNSRLFDSGQFKVVYMKEQIGISKK